MEVEIKLNGAERLRELLEKQNRLVGELLANAVAISAEVGGIRLNKEKQPPAATDGCSD